MSLPDDDQYAQAVGDFEALRRILPQFRKARSWLRGADSDGFSDRLKEHIPPGVAITKGVVRDAAVCALANKGCNTHASVRLVTDSGSGDDAMVLTRVLLETAVLYRWMMLDQPLRLDLYCLSNLLFKRRWAQLVEEHFSAYPNEVAAAKSALTTDEAAVVQAVFGHTKYKWARVRGEDGNFKYYSLEEMLKEIEATERSTTTNFMYGVSYFMHSAHAHATSDGMRNFKTLAREKYFTCELGFNSGNRVVALGSANLYLCWLLSHVAVYLGLRDVEAELDQWLETLKARSSVQGKGESEWPSAGPV